MFVACHLPGEDSTPKSLETIPVHLRYPQPPVFNEEAQLYPRFLDSRLILSYSLLPDVSLNNFGVLQSWFCLCSILDCYLTLSVQHIQPASTLSHPALSVWASVLIQHWEVQILFNF